MAIPLPLVVSCVLLLIQKTKVEILILITEAQFVLCDLLTHGKDLHEHRKCRMGFCFQAKAQIDQEKASRYTVNLLAYSSFQRQSHQHYCFLVTTGVLSE